MRPVARWHANGLMRARESCAFLTPARAVVPTDTGARGRANGHRGKGRANRHWGKGLAPLRVGMPKDC